MANIYSPVKTAKRNRLNTPICANHPQFNAQIRNSTYRRHHSVKKPPHLITLRQSKRVL